MGLLLGAERRADAVATTEAKVLELCQGDLDGMIQESPVWAAMVYRAIAETVARYLSHCVDVHG